MLGDKIVVKPHHTRAAQQAFEKINSRVLETNQRVAITVAGESGSGKSEIASELARLFRENGARSVIYHQDDYFEYPPKTNDKKRREKGLERVGMKEVRMDLLDEHIKKSKNKDIEEIKKPLIDYDNDKILSEVFDLSDIKIVLAEGTYTTALESADIRIFIDRSYKETLEHRKERARDELDEYAEKILEKEHEIISSQKEKADVIITKDYEVSD
ncbi:MAG: uridine kinase family protein [Elusimicrobiota bacterium]